MLTALSPATRTLPSSSVSGGVANGGSSGQRHSRISVAVSAFMHRLVRVWRTLRHRARASVVRVALQVRGELKGEPLARQTAFQNRRNPILSWPHERFFSSSVLSAAVAHTFALSG